MWAPCIAPLSRQKVARFDQKALIGAIVARFQMPKKKPRKAGLLDSRLRGNDGARKTAAVTRYRGSSAASPTGSGGAACAGPWPHLADALAGDVELLADFLEGVVGVHVDAEAHAQHLGFPRRVLVRTFEHEGGQTANVCVTVRRNESAMGNPMKRFALFFVLLISFDAYASDNEVLYLCNWCETKSDFVNLAESNGLSLPVINEATYQVVVVSSRRVCRHDAARHLAYWQRWRELCWPIERNCRRCRLSAPRVSGCRVRQFLRR